MLLGSRRCCLRTQVIVSRASLTSLRTVSDNTILAKLTSVGSEGMVPFELNSTFEEHPIAFEDDTPPFHMLFFHYKPSALQKEGVCE
jgi:hypothetical protein